jgi:hypothetical protein
MDEPRTEQVVAHNRGLMDQGDDGSIRGNLEQIDVAVDELMSIRQGCSPIRAIAILCAVRRINGALSGLKELLEIEVQEEGDN